MAYRGHVKNGVIVLDEPADLAEGTVVIVRLVSNESNTLGKRLLKHAGKAKDLPADASQNHDHYLYGTPKR